MKRLGAIISVLLVSFVLNGCLTGCTANYNTGDVNNDEDESLNMTEKEKELLLASEMYNTGKELIESGNLSEGQQIDLKRVRDMYEYLERKYPGYDIEITRFSSASGLFSAHMHSYDFELMYDGKEYEASIYLEDSKEPEFADNFHSFLFREEYDEKVIELLKNNGYSVRSYTDLSAKVGEVFDEKSTLEEFLPNYPQLKRITHLYIFGEENQETADNIQKILKDSIFGDNCFLYFTGDDSYETVEEYEKNRGKFSSIVF